MLLIMDTKLSGTENWELKEKKQKKIQKLQNNTLNNLKKEREMKGKDFCFKS